MKLELTMEMSQFVGMIASEHPLSFHGVCNASWFTEEVQMMKWLGRWLDYKWRGGELKANATKYSNGRVHFAAFTTPD